MPLPPATTPDAAQTLATRLVQGGRLIVQGRAWRLVEVEWYLHAPGHADPFAHGDPRQRRVGWYLHRRGGTLRGGTWKGLDLAAGAAGAACGLLLRAALDPEGRLVEGPSRLVDALLGASGCAGVQDLDRRLEGLDPLDPACLLRLELGEDAPGAVLACPRVGLGLGREGRARWPWWHQPYRLCSAVERLRRGRVQLACALLAAGEDEAALAARLGRGAQRWALAWRRGLAGGGQAGRDLDGRDLGGLERATPAPIASDPTVSSLDRWAGPPPRGEALAEAIGAWQAVFGAGVRAPGTPARAR